MLIDIKKEIHCFDADGKSVLLRKQLERENAILKARVVQLERLLQAMKRKAEAIDETFPSCPTRH